MGQQAIQQRGLPLPKNPVSSVTGVMIEAVMVLSTAELCAVGAVSTLPA